MCKIFLNKRLYSLKKRQPIAKSSSFLFPQMTSAKQLNWIYSESKPGFKLSATNDTKQSTLF